MHSFYTYMWLREDGTPYYIGKGRDRRGFTSSSHCTHRPKHKVRIFVQYWESEEKAFEMEKWYISLFGRKDKGTGILRNLSDGGEGSAGWVATEEFRSKLREAHLNNPLYIENLNKLKTYWEGRKETEEHKRNIGDAHLGRKHTAEARSNMGAPKGHKRCVGRKYSEETLRKMSEAQKGKPRGPHSVEHKQNISKAKLGVKKSEEARRNMVAAWEIRRKKAQNGK
jgi:hypothetical protein